MTASPFDTSGYVVLTSSLAMRSPMWAESGVAYWTELSPFVQGYLEAAFADAGTALLKPGRAGMFAGFSDIAPSALEAVLRDCERFADLFGEWPLFEHGANFWIGRQKNKHPDFPPLSPHLSDDGKVHGLGEVAS